MDERIVQGEDVIRDAVASRDRLVSAEFGAIGCVRAFSEEVLMMLKPGMVGKSISPTSMYAMAFLKASWRNRDKLTEYERKGFAQFFYLTICGHLEYVLSQQIGGRIFSLRHRFNWDKIARGDVPEVNEEGDTAIARSMIAILDSLDGRVDSASLDKLIELYNQIFRVKIKECVGSELNKDLRALADLRNIFAHGREWSLEFFGEDFPGKGNLDSSPLKGAALRLHAAGIIKTMDFDSKDHHGFTDHFYSDHALLYSLSKAKEIVAKLLESMEVPREKFWLESNCRLPDLKIDAEAIDSR